MCMFVHTFIRVCFLAPVWPVCVCVCVCVCVSVQYITCGPKSTQHLYHCINMCTAVKVSTAVYCVAYNVIQQLIGSLSYKSLGWGGGFSVLLSYLTETSEEPALPTLPHADWGRKNISGCKKLLKNRAKNKSSCVNHHPTQSQDMHSFQFILYGSSKLSNTGNKASP